MRVIAWRVSRAVRQAGCEFVQVGDNFEVRRGNQRIRFARLQVMFAPELAKQFDQYFNATAPRGDKDLRDKELRDYSVPALHFMPSVGVELWVSGVTEGVEHIREHLVNHSPAPGAVVFDVGANCGASALLFSRAVGTDGRVHAFEPDPVNREMLRRNVELHSLTNVVVHPEAIKKLIGGK